MTRRVRQTPSKVGQHRQAEATEAAWESDDDEFGDDDESDDEFDDDDESDDDDERAPSKRHAAMTDSAFDALALRWSLAATAASGLTPSPEPTQP
ncbi:hypothetical protein SDRG_13276 [Saprolegnia diclina VS20]|uniref:Uncharacterized protein n=1 Tax=Saprolegnia diclina (strain VS20) TaxID=1156394 RepID=T0RGP7_SAPDV|nr:hypothetical protein SDRG_13276 [Saprolegnia diclina VS20]EQC28937.1 hypothetical protein SDRG_13276 [Saprolegnia diclina VS20]|eukprot:XP_008617576.1 hypothetical protein SDRG_13276 [Saprolegnia diclina VS20]